MTREVGEPISLSFLSQKEEESRIYEVTEGLRSDHTKKAYANTFNHLLDVTIKYRDFRFLLDTKHSALGPRIIDHITQLKDVEGLSYRSTMVHLSAIFRFFEINDYDDLKRRKIKRFLAEDESDFYSKDRPYSVTEIEKILDKCDVRDRVGVLNMLSTGMRIGGLRELCYGAFT
jgi:integrase